MRIVETWTQRPKICAYELCKDKLIEPNSLVTKIAFRVGKGKYLRHITRVFHPECELESGDPDKIGDGPNQVDVVIKSFESQGTPDWERFCTLTDKERVQYIQSPVPRYLLDRELEGE